MLTHIRRLLHRLFVDRYRSLIGYVPQDATLMAASVADNIRYGAPDATDEQVEEAASELYRRLFGGARRFAVIADSRIASRRVRRDCSLSRLHREDAGGLQVACGRTWRAREWRSASAHCHRASHRQQAAVARIR